MNINRVCFTRNLTAKPEVTTRRKHLSVSAPLANSEFYGCVGYGVGRTKLRNRASLQVSIMGIMTAITTTRNVITMKANPKGTTTAPRGPVDRRAF